MRTPSGSCSTRPTSVNETVQSVPSQNTIPLIDRPTEPGDYGWRRRPQNGWEFAHVYEHRESDGRRELYIQDGGSGSIPLDQMKHCQWCGPFDLPPREK